MFQQRHFVAMAQLLAEHVSDKDGPESMRIELAEAMVEMFKRDNSRFKAELFLTVAKAN